MTTPIQNNFNFSAKWTEENKCFKSTLIDKVSRFALYFFHKITMSICLPATGLKEESNYLSEHAEHYDQKRIEVTTPDGVKLSGTFLQKKGVAENAPCVIFMQPNAALHGHNAFDSIVKSAQIKGKQCNFLFFDYRGCGRSEGSPLQAKELIIDGDSMYQFAKDHLKVPPEEIHMMGWSFGGGVSAQVKALHPECTGNYVNDRSFSCITTAAEKILGGGVIGKIAKVFMKILGWSALDSAKAFDKIQSQALILHHPQDSIIKQEAQLHSKINHTKTNVEIQDLSSEIYVGNFHSLDLKWSVSRNTGIAANRVSEFLIGHVPQQENILDEHLERLSRFSPEHKRMFFSPIANRMFSEMPDREKHLRSLEDVEKEVERVFSLPEEQGGFSNELKMELFVSRLLYCRY